MITPLGQRLFDKGVGQGWRAAILEELNERFDSLPPSLEKQLAPLEDSDRLKKLFHVARTTSSLAEFTQALESSRTRV